MPLIPSRISIFIGVNFIFYCFLCHSQIQTSIKDKEFVSEKILDLIFDGTYDQSRSLQKWKAPKLINYTTNDYFAFSACDTIIDFQQEAIKCRLVIIKTLMIDSELDIISDCNACPPMIGLAVFQNDNEHWILNTFKLDVTRFGHFSSIPESSIIRLGANQWGIKFRDEVVHDIGLEKWFLINETFDPYLTFEYFTVSEKKLLCSELINERVANEDVLLVERAVHPIESEKEFFDVHVISQFFISDESSQSSNTPIHVEKCLFSMGPYDRSFRKF